MPTQPVEFLGVEQATRDLRNVGKRISDAAEKTAATVAQRTRETTAARVPFLTGRMRGSLETLATSDGSIVTYSGDAPYAGWIEFGGTRGRAYFPEGRYLYPTARANEDDFFAAVNADTIREIGNYPWHRTK